MSVIVNYNKTINNFIWGNFGVGFLIFTGILTSICLGFFQFRHFGLWWKITAGSLFCKKNIGHSKDEKSISPFQSLCTSLAATLGVGNIVGVSTAICIGGPGSVFWMWIAALLGMMTSYSENVLGIYFRRKNFQGEWSGGAMYYLRDGLGSNKFFSPVARILASFFAFSTVLASFGIGSMGQINKIVINIESAFDIKSLSRFILYDNVSLYTLCIGLSLFLLAFFIVKDGISGIARFTEKLVPFMIVFFICGSLTVIISNYSEIIPSFKAIFKGAFSFESGFGGGFGIVASQGFKRGVFSNESGLGSSVIVHANSNISEPCEQGMWSIFEVFTDTIVVCTITALVILTSGVYDVSYYFTQTDSATMVASAFNNIFPVCNIGGKFVAISIFLFAFTTVIGWNHYGCKAWEYLFGSEHTGVFRLCHLFSIIPGAMVTSSLAWEISDTFNGLMMIPNLFGVLILLGTVCKITSNYTDRVIKGKRKVPMLSHFYDIERKHKHYF